MAIDLLGGVPYYGYQPTPNDSRDLERIPLNKETQERLREFNRNHPAVDLTPYICDRVNEAVNDVLDEVVKAENG